MILSLRQRHRRMFAVIGIVIPVAFAVGIAARKPVPSVTSLPMGLTASSKKFGPTEWERADLFAKTSVTIRLLRERAVASHFAVSFAAPKDFVKPDLIVYWVAGNPNITDALPDNARLLGAFNSSVALPLPPDIASGTGVLVLYSLADQEVVEVSKPFSAGKLE